MTTVDRIFELMKENGLTAKEFAEKVGVSQGNITDWKTGRAQPSINSLKKIADNCNVQLEWLTGNSSFKTIEEDFNNYTINQNKLLILKTLDRYHSEYIIPCNLKEDDVDFIVNILSSVNVHNAKERKNQLNEYINSFDSVKQKMVKELLRIIIKEIVEDIQNKNTFYYFYSLLNEKNDKLKRNFNKNFFNIPVYGKISAGIPNWAEECLDGYLPIDPNLMGIINPEECFFLKVDGESMNKEIKNGAYALIRKQDIVEDGEIAAVLVNGFEATLKKFSRQGDFVILEPMSTDDSFKTQIYDKNTQIKILGKYIGKFEMNK